MLRNAQTIARMREMSRFSCEVDVMIDGTCTSILHLVNQRYCIYFDLASGVERNSTELVPGDLINLSSSQISVVPSDLFLLSGDTIVNESMLTGESVPVSKTPMKDEDLIRWRELKDENPKSFLYSGTRVVRIRGPLAADGSQGHPALAMVARTGESF